MRQLGNLAKIPEFDKAFWKHLGDEICDEIRVQTQVNSKDVHNRKFKAYKKHAPFWFSKKINGKVIRIYAEDYPTRKPKIKRGSGSGSKVNLTLTGDMMRNLQTRGYSKDSVIIGWSGVDAQKVQHNEEMGRSVTTKSRPLSKASLRLIEVQTNKRIKRNADKETAKPINFKIGK